MKINEQLETLICRLPFGFSIALNIEVIDLEKKCSELLGLAYDRMTLTLAVFGQLTLVQVGRQ